MSDEVKPELTHEFPIHGCTIKHTLHGERAICIDPDGNEHEFEANLGMIAQDAPSATLLAMGHAKRDKRQREELEAEERKRKRAEKVLREVAAHPEAKAIIEKASTQFVGAPVEMDAAGKLKLKATDQPTPPSATPNEPEAGEPVVVDSPIPQPARPSGSPPKRGKK